MGSFEPLLVIAAIGAGAASAAALVYARNLHHELTEVQRQLAELMRHVAAINAASGITDRDSTSTRTPRSIREHTSRETFDSPGERPAVVKAPSESVVSSPPPLPAARSVPAGDAATTRGMEFQLGSKWMAWIGILLFVVAVGFFLKYLYDNEVIGPRGRLAIGVLTGAGALCAGEYYRRKHWQALHQTLTGGGLAIFYVCVYFAFHIYGVVGSTFALALGMLVTALGVTLSVSQNALPIAFLATFGGFLSPLIFSDGPDRPYQLFSYLAVLDLVALGAAYFRQWRVLDLFCFVCTTALYQLWYVNHSGPDAFTPGLIFTTLFFLLFLMVPLSNAWTQKRQVHDESLALVVLNVGHAVFSYYSLLFVDHRNVLGFVVLAQSGLVFGLYRVWRQRSVGIDRTGDALLLVSIALATIAVPIHLRLYTVPVVWAMEGALLAYLGSRSVRPLLPWSAVAAFGLSLLALLLRLPLHDAPFDFILNVPFGSWAVVIAALAAGGFALRSAERQEPPGIGAGLWLAAYIAGAFVLTLETSAWWTVHRPDGFRTGQFNTLVALWSVLPFATTVVLSDRTRNTGWFVLPVMAYGTGIAVFFTGFLHYGATSPLLAAHSAFLCRALLVVALFAGALVIGRQGVPGWPRGFELAGHTLLAVLAAFELHRWADVNDRVSGELAAVLLVSVWAAHAFVLIWFGLATGAFYRRGAGFVLFALTIFVVAYLAVEIEIDPALKIIAFGASGLLLIGAARFYQRFSAMFLDSDSKSG